MRTPSFWCPEFFLSLSSIIFSENLICVVLVVKKFEFWRFRFRKIPSFCMVPPNFVSFIFPLFLLTLKFLCVFLGRLKNLNYGGPVWGGKP